MHTLSHRETYNRSLKMVRAGIPLRLAREFAQTDEWEERADRWLTPPPPPEPPAPAPLPAPKTKKATKPKKPKRRKKFKDWQCGKCGDLGHTVRRCLGAGNKPRRRGKRARDAAKKQQ